MLTTDHIRPGDEFHGWTFDGREATNEGETFVFVREREVRRIALPAADGFLKLMQMLREQTPIYV